MPVLSPIHPSVKWVLRVGCFPNVLGWSFASAQVLDLDLRLPTQLEQEIRTASFAGVSKQAVESGGICPNKIHRTAFSIHISLRIQSYPLRFGGSGVGARRVQSYLLRRYDWISRVSLYPLGEVALRGLEPSRTAALMRTVFSSDPPYHTDQLPSVVHDLEPFGIPRSRVPAEWARLPSGFGVVETQFASSRHGVWRHESPSWTHFTWFTGLPPC